MQTEHLVIIATFNNVARADAAQAELVKAGIQGLLMSAPPASTDDASGNEELVSLAVNERDVNVATALLSPTLDAS